MNRLMVAIVVVIVAVAAFFGGRMTADDEDDGGGASIEGTTAEGPLPAQCAEVLSLGDRLSEEALSAISLAQAAAAVTPGQPAPPPEVIAERAARVQALAQQLQTSQATCEAVAGIVESGIPPIGTSTTSTTAAE